MTCYRHCFLIIIISAWPGLPQNDIASTRTGSPVVRSYLECPLFFSTSGSHAEAGIGVLLSHFPGRYRVDLDAAVMLSELFPHTYEHRGFESTLVTMESVQLIVRTGAMHVLFLDPLFFGIGGGMILGYETERCVSPQDYERRGNQGMIFDYFPQYKIGVAVKWFRIALVGQDFISKIGISFDCFLKDLKLSKSLRHITIYE